MVTNAQVLEGLLHVYCTPARKERVSRSDPAQFPQGILKRPQAPSGRWQASYLGPDLARRTAPRTFETKGAAVAWLGLQREELLSGGLAAALAGSKAPRSRSTSTPPSGYRRAP